MVCSSRLPAPVETVVYETEHEANTSRGEKSCYNQAEAGILLDVLQNGLGNIRINDP
jgi:hypothetical protein